jgi:hypothetical protein
VQLLTNVCVFDFRSISSVEIDPGALTALIGGNGSGKSNLLRALNLFFNGEVEPGQPVDLRRDFHKPWRTTRDRTIAVRVTFQLPPHFSIHQKLRESLASVGIEEGKTFSLEKQWERDAIREGLISESTWISFGEDASELVDAQGARNANRFLQLIRFRYIPNHIHPTELLRSENPALQEALMIALKKMRSQKGAGTPAEVDALLRDMGDGAKTLMKPIADALASSPGHIEGVELATPTDWAEVIWSIGIKLRAADVKSLDIGLHGSGNQTFLAYVLLAFLDTRFGQRFGWHQSTVWGVEEPESFLHADLKNQLAGFLVSSCDGPRFQGILTTHDLLFAAASDSNYEVTLKQGATETEAVPTLELSNRTLASGVTPFVHPLNLTAPKPTLLVDGPFDAYYLTEAYIRSGRTNPWDIRSLETLDPQSGTGGRDNIKKYLKQNKGPLQARPLTSPVIVLLDWEDTPAQQEAVQELLNIHPSSKSIVWQVGDGNAELGDSFHGIERFLGTALVADVGVDADVGVVRRHADPPTWELMPAKRTSAKQELRRRCEERNEIEDLRPIIGALNWLESHIPAKL